MSNRKIYLSVLFLGLVFQYETANNVNMLSKFIAILTWIGFGAIILAVLFVAYSQMIPSQ